MIKEYSFEIHKSIILNANKKLHRFVHGKIARDLREIGRSKTENETTKFNFFDVDVVIYPPTRRRLDPPNLYQTVKHLIDGMTDSGLWEDDDWTHMRSMSFQHGGDTSGIKETFIIKIIVKEIN